jgi:hypothetical protein
VEKEIDLSVVNVIALSMDNTHLLDDTHQWNRGKADAEAFSFVELFNTTTESTKYRVVDYAF